MKNTLSEIEVLLQEQFINKDDSERDISKFKLFKERVDAWKAHHLRTVHQDYCREEILLSLEPDSFYLYCNWAMKFIPTKFRQPQIDFFGKKSLSWYISVVLKLNKECLSSSSIMNMKLVISIFIKFSFMFSNNVHKMLHLLMT